MINKFYDALKNNQFEKAVEIAKNINPLLIKKEFRDHCCTTLLTTGLTMLINDQFKEFLSSILSKYQVIIDGIKTNKIPEWTINIDKNLDKKTIGNDLLSSARLLLTIK